MEERAVAAGNVPTWLLPVPVLAGAALRVLVWTRVHAPPGLWVGDASSYRDLAAAFLQGRLRPDVFVWGPGYPLLGALLSPFHGPGAGLVLASLLCGVALPALAVLAGRAAGLGLTGFVAGFVLAAYPDLVIAGARPLSESAALLLIAACGISVEVARRTRRVRWAVAAGLLGGFAILTRAELVVSFVSLAAFLVALAGGRRVRFLLAVFAPALLLVAPYALAYQNGTGQWGLSLKPHMNVIRSEIHATSATTLEARDRWDTLLDAELLENGEFSARRMAAAVSPSAYLLRWETIATWFHNVGLAAARSTWWERILWIAGILGLTLGDKAARTSRWIAAILALPYLAVPVFLPYLGRHMLVAVPPLAWGTGALVSRCVSLAGSRRAVIAVAGTAVALLGVAFARTAFRAADELPWEDVGLETRRAVQEGDFAFAARLATWGVERRPRDPRFRDLLGMVHAESGDPEAAESSLREGVRLGGSPHNLVSFLSRQGRTDDAEQVLEGARASLDPREYWMLAADVSHAAGRWPEEADRLARVEVLSGSSQGLSLRIGEALMRAGRSSEAVDPLTRATKGPDPVLRRQAGALLDGASRSGSVRE